MGEPEYSIRPVEEVQRDIDWYAEHAMHLDTAFLGDADPLSRPIDESLEIIKYLREKNPQLKRVTAYARSSTLYKLGYENSTLLRQAGLDRVHTGLESGNRDVLKFQRKGQSAKIILQSGQWIKQAGIELSYYVLLGLGGADNWEKHIDDTALIINQTDPEFIRLRRLWIYKGDYGATDKQCPLWEDIVNNSFIPQTPEGTVLELKRLIEQLEGVNSMILCDHANNYIRINGKIPEDKATMINEIETFLKLPQQTRKRHYKIVGSEI